MDQVSFKDAIKRFAKSVAIITTAKDGMRYAMPATAVTPLANDPASLLFCVEKTASSYPVLASGTEFAVNLLSLSQKDIAERCMSAKGEARFEGAPWKDDGGVPYLETAQASFVCTQDGRHSYATHDIFIGRVRSIRMSGETDPLVFIGGGFKGAK
jgi:flavin reductase (DIM6/NTAB) family NADH-FMN oxidoreductase RutF